MPAALASVAAMPRFAAMASVPTPSTASVRADRRAWPRPPASASVSRPTPQRISAVVGRTSDTAATSRPRARGTVSPAAAMSCRRCRKTVAPAPSARHTSITPAISTASRQTTIAANSLPWKTRPSRRAVFGRARRATATGRAVRGHASTACAAASPRATRVGATRSAAKDCSAVTAAAVHATDERP